MEKKILVIIPGFKHGGTNRSLYNLLSLVNKELKIDIFSMSTKGFYYNLFKNNYLLKSNLIISSLMSSIQEEKNISRKLFIFLIKGIIKIASLFQFDLKGIIYRKIANKKQFKGYYTIIAFQEGEATLFGSYLNSSNKIGWIHCDYAEYLNYLNIPPEKELYSRFNKIVCVSKYTKQLFTQLIPEMGKRTVTIHNSLNVEKVVDLSKDVIFSNCFKEDTFKIISVGRFDKYKNFSSIPKIASELKSNGLKFKWVLVGSVNHITEYHKFKKNIDKFDVNDCIFYLGEVNNPYPYISASDLLVSTSLSEAFPYVIMEAKVLNIPVIATNFGSAEECILNGKEGIIASIENIGSAILEMYLNKDYYKGIKSYLMNNRYDNELIMTQFYQIL